jgi:acetoacetyl-CoA synthetase
MFPRPDFFPTSDLNFAENLLYPANVNIDPTSTAIIEANESSSTSISWAELRERVRLCALSLRAVDVRPHDRVAGFLGNHANTLIAALAAASIGAVWTGVSPDTGVHAVLERLVQIEPKILFTDNAVAYNGRVHSSAEKTRGIVEGLRGKGLRAVIVFETVKDVESGVSNLTEVLDEGAHAWDYANFLEQCGNPSHELEFAALPPSHPLYILYSSGTTGPPKCIVHSALGTLLQHKKEHVLHCDLRPESRLFYYTTTTWMMWHWLVSALASGSSIVLYDGSPFKPNGDMSMPKLIDELQITHFGTSAKYLSILEQKNIRPMEQGAKLTSLQAIYSTGSPLAPSTFEYIYESWPKTVQLASITGGTDIISLFGAPNPILPVYRGEIQAPGLGLSLAAYSEDGVSVPPGESGDLVATRPFICQPVAFWGNGGDVADGMAKYKAAYFEEFEGVWHHGDFISFIPHTPAGHSGKNNGASGLMMLGRSDGTLKPSGVRFGSAEIYNILLAHFPEVEDAVCVGRRREGEQDETVVLFVMMAAGAEFSTGAEGLEGRIKAEIGKRLSLRHVPGIVVEGGGVPITGNGKKVEIAVKQIVSGKAGKVGKSVVNQEVLDWYHEWAKNN